MKPSLRKILREQRRQLDPLVVEEKNQKIRIFLEKNHHYRSAKNILFYASLPDEVDTLDLIEDALSQGHTVHLPKIHQNKLLICPIQNWEDLEENDFGILEPCQILEEKHPTDMDLILIPGLAFDHQGHRLGYGKGHYDRLLKSTRGLKIGLAFSEQILEKLPIESHDVPVDLIITDQGPMIPKP